MKASDMRKLSEGIDDKTLNIILFDIYKSAYNGNFNLKVYSRLLQEIVDDLIDLGYDVNNISQESQKKSKEIRIFHIIKW